MNSAELIKCKSSRGKNAIDGADNNHSFYFLATCGITGLALDRINWKVVVVVVGSVPAGEWRLPPDEAVEPICWTKGGFTSFLINLNWSRSALWQPGDPALSSNSLKHIF